MIKAKVVTCAQRLDAMLIGFFARPWPHKAAEFALWGVTHIEQTFFMPFRFLSVPARCFLDYRHARQVRKHHER